MLRVDPAGRGDLLAFTERALRLDEAAVIRLRARADGLLGAWAATGFDVLAVRVVPGSMQPADMTCAADALRCTRSGSATCLPMLCTGLRAVIGS